MKDDKGQYPVLCFNHIDEVDRLSWPVCMLPPETLTATVMNYHHVILLCNSLRMNMDINVQDCRVMFYPLVEVLPCLMEDIYFPYELIMTFFRDIIVTCKRSDLLFDMDVYYPSDDYKESTSCHIENSTFYTKDGKLRHPTRDLFQGG